MAYRSALDALGDGTRRSVLEALRAGPRSVGEIAEGLPVSRPAVSQHLRVLRDAGLVTVAREGKRNVYRIDPRGLREVRAYLEGLWERAPASFKEVADRREEAHERVRRGPPRPSLHRRR